MKALVVKLASGLSCVTLLSSCATIVSGTKQPVRFTSDPAGADVRVDGVIVVRTPGEVELPVRHEHTVSIELPGYAPYQTRLTRSFNGWILGNLFIGGVIGIIVDLSTGAVYGLKPSQVNAQLIPTRPMKGRRAAGGSNVSGGKLYIGTTLKPDASWQKIGQLQRL